MTDGDRPSFGPRDLGARLVGREEQLEVLRSSAKRASSERQTRIVTLIGGPGIGKSRLIEELLGDLHANGPALRVYSGSARATHASFGVFTRLLRSRFGVVEGTDPEAQKARVRDEVAKVLEDRKVDDVCYFLGQLMELPFPGSALTRAIADDALQARLLCRAVVRSFIEADAAQAPSCVVFEDLHLADDDSIELLRHLMVHLAAPALLLATMRPELLIRQEDWFEFGKERHDKLEVAPLDDANALELTRALLAPCAGGPPEPLVDAALGMAGGNPGLLEQMVRIFHESGVLEESETQGTPLWRVHLDKLARARLPMTVDDAVSARISSLSSNERRLLEHAAAMGSVFWLGGMIALERADSDPPELWAADDVSDVGRLRAMLEELKQRDYVLELPDSMFSDETEFIFKHNLEREKIAGLISATAARRYHQTLADWLAQKDSISAHEEHSAMLARHLEQAGARAQAGKALLDAADLARQSYATKKAHDYYAQGLALLGDSNARRRIDALHNYGDVLSLLGRTDEALAAFRDMLALAYRLGIKPKGGAAHNRIGRLYRDTGSLVDAEQHLSAALALFRAVDDVRGVAASYDDIGKLLWMRGDYDHALKELKTALELRKKLGDRRSIALSLNNIGLVWMDHGIATRAADALEAALKIRREIGDPLGIVQSLNNLGQLAQDQADYGKALKLFREAHDVAKEIGERNRIAVVLTNIGEALCRIGNSAEALRILKEAEELCDDLGDKLHLAEAKRGMAKAYLLQHDLKKARESIKHAVDLFGQVRSRAHLAVALRTLGEITAAGAWGKGHEGKAIDYFLRSIAICREIGNELEVAKSYRAFSTYVAGSEHYRLNADIQREAKKLSQMAEEIFERHRTVASNSA